MDVDFETALARGLSRYVRLVADTLGLGDGGYYVQVEPSASAYLPLDGRLAAYPDHDVALIWDQVHGWALGIEANAEDVVPVRYLGGSLLPLPSLVARFVNRLFREQVSGRAEPPARLDSADLVERLRAYGRPQRKEGTNEYAGTP